LFRNFDRPKNFVFSPFKPQREPPPALSAMNAMSQLNVVALHHLYAAEQR
jgi:hypothetical protein